MECHHCLQTQPCWYTRNMIISSQAARVVNEDDQRTLNPWKTWKYLLVNPIHNSTVEMTSLSSKGVLSEWGSINFFVEERCENIFFSEKRVPCNLKELCDPWRKLNEQSPVLRFQWLRLLRHSGRKHGALVFSMPKLLKVSARKKSRI